MGRYRKILIKSISIRHLNSARCQTMSESFLLAQLSWRGCKQLGPGLLHVNLILLGAAGSLGHLHKEMAKPEEGEPNRKHVSSLCLHHIANILWWIPESKDQGPRERTCKGTGHRACPQGWGYDLFDHKQWPDLTYYIKSVHHRLDDQLSWTAQKWGGFGNMGHSVLKAKKVPGKLKWVVSYYELSCGEWINRAAGRGRLLLWSSKWEKVMVWMMWVAEELQVGRYIYKYIYIDLYMYLREIFWR